MKKISLEQHSGFEGTSNLSDLSGTKTLVHAAACGSKFKGCYNNLMYLVLKQAIIHLHRDCFHHRCVASSQLHNAWNHVFLHSNCSSGWSYEVYWMHINVDRFLLVLLYCLKGKCWMLVLHASIPLHSTPSLPAFSRDDSDSIHYWHNKELFIFSIQIVMKAGLCFKVHKTF